MIDLAARLPGWVVSKTTEIAVTDRRTIYRHGVNSGRAVKMDMGKVQSVDVDRSVWGRLLNSGTLTVLAAGEASNR